MTTTQAQAGSESQADDNDPQSSLYERAVAGALLLASPTAAAQALDRIADDDIDDPRSRFVVATVRRMVGEGVPVDTVTFAGYTERHNLIDPGPARTHAASYAFEIAATAPVPDALPYYTDLVLEAAARRRVAAAGAELQRLAAGSDLDQLTEVAQGELAAVVKALGRVSA